MIVRFCLSYGTEMTWDAKLKILLFIRNVMTCHYITFLNMKVTLRHRVMSHHVIIEINT